MSKTRLEGSIAVKTYEETTHDASSDGGPTLKQLRITESFEGGIAGEGAVWFLQSLRSDGSATFCGTERVHATVDGKTGTFLLQDQGELASDGTVKGTWFVVPNSGTGQLRGLRGDGGFEAQVGAHARYHLDAWFEG